jgi:ABC-type antimicrobial peptide transport system permease subunit
MALGSSPLGMVGLVMKRSVRLAAIGVVVGGGLAAIALRVLVALTASVEMVEWDTVALLTGVSLAGSVGVLAALGPSSRAARVDPNTVLRAD